MSNEKEIFYVDFKRPIDFSIRITKLYEVETTTGLRLFIQGDEISKGLHVEFYCPANLEYILRKNFNDIGRGDRIRIEYLGREKTRGSLQQSFFVEKIEDEENE